MRKIAIFILLALLLAFGVAPAYANSGIPSLPHAFYGSVTINDSPAPDGVKVSAMVDNGTVIPTQNPVTTVGGSYGIDSPRLLVQGDITPLATITFYVTNANGTAIGGTAIFESGGGPDWCALSVNIAPPEPSPRAPALYIETNLFGVEKSFRIDSDGEILQTIEATSEDGNLTLYLPRGTIALDKYGNPLDSLEAAVDENPPPPPEDGYIIGLPYIFEPSGATFAPPITFIWSYDPEDLPEGVAEEDQVIAYYDEDAGEWIELKCVVDTENNTITALVSHFTTIAIIAVLPPPPAPIVAPPPPVVPPVVPPVAPPPVAPPAPAPVVTAPPPVVTAPPPVVTAPPPVVTAPVPVAPVAPVAPPLPPTPPPTPEMEPVTEFNWFLYGGIIAVVIVVGLLIIYFVVFRRRA